MHLGGACHWAKLDFPLQPTVKAAHMIVKVMLGSLEDAWIPFSYSIQCLGTVEINTDCNGFTCKTGETGRLTKRSGKLRFI